MDLKTYLEKNRMSITQFSEELGYCRAHVSHIVNGRAVIGRKLAKQIENYTKGSVTASELMEYKHAKLDEMAMA